MQFLTQIYVYCFVSSKVEQTGYFLVNLWSIAEYHVKLWLIEKFYDDIMIINLYSHSDRTSNRRWSHCDTTADISMIMMMGGNFMQGGEIFTALPHFQVMNGMCVTIK